mmetsp:Transcript_14052/g.41269  ORF Transcript_14052/g.41269 Transcript_14052/m.41269 type:complete len:333 (+) Transcript_14052:663-1661(+)
MLTRVPQKVGDGGVSSDPGRSGLGVASGWDTRHLQSWDGSRCTRSVSRSDAVAWVSSIPRALRAWRGTILCGSPWYVRRDVSTLAAVHRTPVVFSSPGPSSLVQHGNWIRHAVTRRASVRTSGDGPWPTESCAGERCCSTSWSRSTRCWHKARTGAKRPPTAVTAARTRSSSITVSGTMRINSCRSCKASAAAAARRSDTRRAATIDRRSTASNGSDIGALDRRARRLRMSPRSRGWSVARRRRDLTPLGDFDVDRTCSSRISQLLLAGGLSPLETMGLTLALLDGVGATADPGRGVPASCMAATEASEAAAGYWTRWEASGVGCSAVGTRD